MSEKKHTELPWIAERDTYGGVSGVHHPKYGMVAQTLAPQYDREEDPENTEAQANAEFIVRACNAHYAMRDALKGISTILDNLPQGSDQGSVNRALLNAIRKADSALALAEGKE